MLNIIGFIALTIIAICIVAIIIVYMIFQTGKEETKQYISVITSLIILFVVCTFASIQCFNNYISYVQSDAIDHYVVGDYELKEIYDENGDIVDWRYIIIPSDYE